MFFTAEPQQELWIFFFFLIQSDNLCLVLGVFRPLIFNYLTVYFSVQIHYHHEFSIYPIVLCPPFLFPFSFWNRTRYIWKFPGLGLNWSYSCRPGPQPQQRGIWAKPAIYTTAHCNTRSLTHWARPGIKPLSSWVLVRFINHWATMGTLVLCPFWSIFLSLVVAD